MVPAGPNHIDVTAAEWPDARILAVDDEPANLRFLERMLESAGYRRLETTTDPQGLLDRLQQDEPDLILLDLQMPTLDGFEVLKRIDEIKPYEHYVPILVLTADASPDARRRALRLGAHDFLTKPFDAVEALLRIRNLIHARAQHLELRQRGERLRHEVRLRGDDLALYLTVLETIQDPVVIEDPSARRVVYANSAMGRALVGRDLDGNPWSGGALAECAPAVHDGRADSTMFEGYLEHEGGREVHVDVAVQSLRHRGRRLLVGVARDVTSRKQAEETLAEAVEREREAADRLRRLDDLKNTLLTAVSHELRTPLTVILGLAQTFEARGHQLTAEQLQSLAPRLATNARRLQRLLDDLLDVDKLTRGMAHVDRREVELGDTVMSVLDEAPLGGRRLDTHVDSFRAEVDPTKFERIVANLVGNAVRHTPSNATITVSLTHGSAIHLSVVDDGPGIPDEAKGSVFEPFTQGVLRDAHSPGTGVGLALVRMFVELHGGRVWVEDAPGGGAAFHVELPNGASAED